MKASCFLITAFLAISTVACADNDEPIQYSQVSLSPLTASRQDAGNVRIDFNVPPESQYYIAGSDYQVVDGVLSVKILRCSIHEKCKAMVELAPGLPPAMGQLVIPFEGSRVNIEHGDGIQSFDI